MAVKFLDKTGLDYFLGKIKAWCNNTFAAITHNQASNTINVMTGYSKPSSGSAITTSDSLNNAIGKLEAKVDAVDDSNYVHLTGDETVAGTKTFSSTITGSVSGNAGTATQFSANTTVALTGDATGTSAGSKKGWSVPVTLSNSGVTAGSYGPSDNATPGYGTTFNVPYITVDAKGRVTAAATHTVKIPASDDTNNKVSQTVSTENLELPLLAKDSNATSTVTSGSKFAAAVKLNPSTGTITATKFKGGIEGNADTATKTKGVFLVIPNETAQTATLTATVEGITEYFPGLTVALRMPFASAASSTLNINSLGAKPIYYNNNTVNANYYPANSVVILVYETTTASTGCWKMAYSYDSNTNNATAQNISTANDTYPILIGSTANATANIGNKATYFCKDVKINPSTGIVSANGFSGPLAGNVTGNVSGSSGSCTGNAGSATKLATTRAINGTNFDGSAAITTANWGTARNISISDSDGTNTGTAVSVNGSGNVTLKLPATIKASITGNCSGSSGSCTGNAATATKLATARDINISDADGTNTGTKISFNGTANGTIKLPATIKASITGNCSGSSGSCTGNAATATTLKTARKINGVSFNGSADITVADSTKVAKAGDTMTGNLTVPTVIVSGSFVKQHPSITKGTNPSATQYWTLTFGDKNGSNYSNNCLGMLETSITSAGVVSTYIRAMKNTAANSSNCQISCIYDTANNTAYTAAPTPATADNSTKIATTAFVKAQNYITSSSNITGTSANVTGTVAIANGGTGATTRLNAVKSLTNENVGTGATYFLTITNSWGKAGYTSAADARTVLAMKGATSSAAGTAGVVPAPPTSGYNTKYLRADGTWQVPPDNNTVYTHPTTSGNKHIPSGGKSGQILRWSADGTAAWGADNNTTYSVATQSANGLMSDADKKKLDGIAAGADSIPVGTIIYYTNKTVPANFLICNGGAVSRTTYATLFGIIGTTFGAGNGSSTFNVPNLIDRFPQGNATPGTVKAAGLPNIVASVNGVIFSDYHNSGAFSTANPPGDFEGSSGNVAYQNPGGFYRQQLNFSAKSSNSIYGNSSTVQPPALTLVPCIRYA